jgi:hypothetical protein
VSIKVTGDCRSVLFAVINDASTIITLRRRRQAGYNFQREQILNLCVLSRDALDAEKKVRAYLTRHFWILGNFEFVLSDKSRDIVSK